MDGFGNINWWGFSPCIDLLEHFNEKSKAPDEELNVLLVCAGDQRHILKTIASQAKRTGKRKIHFYVYEKMLELYARDLLLLNVALEHPSKRGVQEKTELFLEIYGNLLVRDYSAKYVQEKANEFIKFITDLENSERTSLNMFNFDLLKFKERDFLEGIFKFWRLKNEPDRQYFPAEKCWEFRLRNYLKTRYDTRKNAFDWDFSMKLMDRKNAGVIHHKVYGNWRETGVAFDLRDVQYDLANFTLASSHALTDPKSGDKTARRGYFGDIIVGPYLAYGIESSVEKFFKKQNEMYRHTATDISRDNVTKYIQSVLELSGIDLKKYQANEKKEDEMTGKLSEVKICEVIEEEEEEDTEPKTEADVNVEEGGIILEDYKVSFLPLTALQDITSKPKYEKFFDVVYLANSAAGCLTTGIHKSLSSEALVIVETAKFMIELDGEKILGFSEKMRELAKGIKLTEVEIPCEPVEKCSFSGKPKEEKTKLEKQNNIFFQNGKV